VDSLSTPGVPFVSNLMYSLALLNSSVHTFIVEWDFNYVKTASYCICYCQGRGDAFYFGFSHFVNGRGALR